MGSGESHPVIRVRRQKRVVVAVARHGEFGLHAPLRSPEGGTIIPPVDQRGPFWERWPGCYNANRHAVENNTKGVS